MKEKEWRAKLDRLLDWGGATDREKLACLLSAACQIADRLDLSAPFFLSATAVAWNAQEDRATENRIVFQSWADEEE